MPHPTDALFDDLTSRRASVAVIGLGYVGLPLAICLAKRFPVIGYDTDARRVATLNQGRDPVGECADAAVAASGIRFTSEESALTGARFAIVCVPTPIDRARQPDLGPLRAACAALGRQLRPGAVVVFESTVYPGCTEEVCIGAIAAEKGLVPGRDFTYGYSPERINPGDREHTIATVVKVVSGCDAPTLATVAAVYGAAIPAGVFRASSVRVAEAAKVIENTQRDLNIALMNELALIFHRLGLDTAEVLAAAATKWNFLPFRPGLVGGHCIGVDPYYLTHKAESEGHHAEVILAGRRINDAMGLWVAHECVRLLCARGTNPAGARVLVLGLSFKEEVRDVRNSRVADLVHELRRFGCIPLVIDPIADPEAARHEHGIDLIPGEPLPRVEAIVAAVAHRAFINLPIDRLAAAAPKGAPFLDVKSAFDRTALAVAGFTVWRL